MMFSILQFFKVTVLNPFLNISLRVHNIISFFVSSSVAQLFQKHVTPEDLKEFSYKPLTEPAEIRVLEIHAGEGEETVQCTVKHLSLDHPQEEYMALSYTWGPTDNPRLVICNGQRISVTANLHAALRKCRPEKTRLTLWADAICINQSDPSERGSQVQMMRRIYQQAQRVVVDLGQAGEGAELVPPLLTRIVMLVGKHGMDWTIPQFEFDEHGLPPASASDWKALNFLLCRPWFRRVWIIQEVAMAKRLTVVYGSSLLAWKDLFVTISWLNQQGMISHVARLGEILPTGLPVALIASVNLFNIVNIREAIERQKPKPLSEILRHARSFQATDPKDKAYALWGLAPDVDDLEFDIIYDSEETLEKVYIRLAQALIGTEDAYYVLVAAGTATDLRGLPSWVPDWSCEAKYTSFSLLNKEGERESGYCAGGMGNIRATVMADKQKLAITGFFVDTISSLSDVYHSSPPEDNEGMRRLIQWEAHSRRLIFSMADYPTGEPVQDAYRRTLVANKDKHGDKALPSFLQHYDRMLAWLQIEEQVKATGETVPSPENLGFDQDELTLIYASLVEYAIPMASCMDQRRLCLTKKGYLGLVPDVAKEADSIFVVLGAEVPFVLSGCDGEYRLLGDCYLHGLMEGKALEMDDFSVQDVILR